jgi:hypothetical protein
MTSQPVNLLVPPPGSYSYPHWSASRFMAWDQCPGVFADRYVRHSEFEPSEALAYGKAMHLALEDLYAGRPAERALRGHLRDQYAWWGQPIPAGTVSTAIDLLAMVEHLGLKGRSEWGFHIRSDASLGAPTVGAIDLLDLDHPSGPIVYDFKTTVGTWGADRVAQELWQPAIYLWAVYDQFGVEARFQYVVLNRARGTVQVLDSPRTLENSFGPFWDRARPIVVDAYAGRFTCNGKHPACYECGTKWSHAHVCPQDRPPYIRLRPPEFDPWVG